MNEVAQHLERRTISRRIVGWSMGAHVRADLVVDAVTVAVRTREPSAGLIHHSDHGWPYTSIAFPDDGCWKVAGP